jgi:hypothetical protein
VFRIGYSALGTATFSFVHPQFCLSATARCTFALEASAAMASPIHAERRITASCSNEELEDDPDGVQFVELPAQSRSTISHTRATVPPCRFYGTEASGNEARNLDSAAEMTALVRPAKRSVRIHGDPIGAGSSQSVVGSVAQDLDGQLVAEATGMTTRQLRPRVHPGPGNKLSFPVPRKSNAQQQMSSRPVMSTPRAGRQSPLRSRTQDLAVSSHDVAEENSVTFVKEAQQRCRMLSPPHREGNIAASNRKSPTTASNTISEDRRLRPPQATLIKSAVSPAEVHDVDSDISHDSSQAMRQRPESPAESGAREQQINPSSASSLKHQESSRHDLIAAATIPSPIREQTASDMPEVAHITGDAPSFPKFEEPPLRMLFSFPPGEHRGKVQVTNEDLSRLQTGCYLNDNLIDFYVKWVDHVLAPPLGSRGENFFFSSFFFGRLRCSSPIDYAGVQRWTNDADDLFKKRFVFVPVCDSNHWSLILVANLDRIGAFVQGSDSQWVGNTVDRPSILYLDSLSSARGTDFAKVMKAYLVEEWLFRKEQGCDSGKEVPSERCEVVKAVFAKVMRVVKPRVPVQNNEFDCGLYLLYNIVAFIRDDEGFRAKCFLSPTLFTGANALQRAYTQGDIRVLRVELKHIIQSLMTPEARRAVHEDDRRKEIWRIEIEESKKRQVQNTSNRDLANYNREKANADVKPEMISDSLSAPGALESLPRVPNLRQSVERDTAPEAQPEFHFEETVEDSGLVVVPSSGAQSIANCDFKGRGTEDAGGADKQCTLPRDAKNNHVNDEAEPCSREDVNVQATAEGPRQTPRKVDSVEDFDNCNEVLATVQMAVERPQRGEISRLHGNKSDNDPAGNLQLETMCHEESNGSIDEQRARSPQEVRARPLGIVSFPSAEGCLTSKARMAVHDQPLAKRTRRMAGGSGSVMRNTQTSSNDQTFALCSGVHVMETDSSALDVDGHAFMHGSPVATPEAADEQNMSMMIVDSGDGRIVDFARPMDES